MALVITGLAVACTTEPADKVECSLFDVSGCKQKTQTPNKDTDLSSSNYHWLVNGNLEINRNNITASCSPEQWIVEAKVKDGRIEVEERFFEDKSECLCKRDLRYEISGISAGDYVIVINGQTFGGVRIY